MYDKVKLWVNRFDIGEQYPNIINLLDTAKEQTDLNTREVKVFGYLEGLRLNIFQSGLSIEGSLPKFLYQSNIYTLNRQTTPQAFEKIGDKLHFNIKEAKVLSLEFGANYNMQYPVYRYLEKLGDMPRLERSNYTASSLYYKPRSKAQQKIFSFYDKIAEAKAKKMIVPNGLEDANLLRYEMRLKGRLPTLFKRNEVTASTLSEEQFYSSAIKMYQDTYFSISKQNKLTLNDMSNIKTVKDAKEVLMALLINQSDQEQIKAYFDALKEAKVFEDRKNYTRLKNKIKEISNKAGYVVPDDLIKELDNEIKNIGAYV